MIAKYWKKIGLFILIIACLFNVVIKLVSKTSMKDELKASAIYVREQEYEKEENK